MIATLGARWGSHVKATFRVVVTLSWDGPHIKRESGLAETGDWKEDGFPKANIDHLRHTKAGLTHGATRRFCA